MYGTTTPANRRVNVQWQLLLIYHKEHLAQRWRSTRCWYVSVYRKLHQHKVWSQNHNVSPMNITEIPQFCDKPFCAKVGWTLRCSTYSGFFLSPQGPISVSRSPQSMQDDLKTLFHTDKTRSLHWDGDLVLIHKASQDILAKNNQETLSELGTGPVFNPYVSKALANERRRYISNVFSHWLRPWRRENGAWTENPEARLYLAHTS